jgi:hypothetical protein
VLIFSTSQQKEQNEVDNKYEQDMKVKGKAVQVQAYCKTRSVPGS